MVKHKTYIQPPYKKGEKVGTSKLTAKEVKEIKLKLRQGIKGVGLAEKYNVTTACISLIKRNVNWSWITLP
jgi:hypothetical protein